jgi:hypothetical protein
MGPPFFANFLKSCQSIETPCGIILSPELRQRIKLLLGCKNTTLREIQSIIGLLYFACQVVIPGRPFCRRHIDATCKVKKSWHKVRISVWLNFLDSYNSVSVILDHPDS